MTLKQLFAPCERIVSFGCSLTFGDELSDIVIPGPTHDVNHNRPSNLTYAALLAEHCGKPYLCKAIPGGANNQIERLLMNHVRNNPKDGVIIGWTSITRHEFHSNEIGYQSFLVGGDYRQIQVGEHDWRKIQQAYDAITALTEYPHLLSAFNRQVFMVQSTLKYLKIPFLMVHAFGHTHYTPEEFDGLDIIKIGRYHSFYDWAQKWSYSKGPFGHPLDAAHAAYAKEIIKVYNETT